MSDKNGFGAFLLGFAIGGLTGAAVSLLFAPQTGSETRTYLKERAIEIGDKANEVARTASEQVKDAANEAKGKATELVEKGQTVIQEQTAKIAEVIPTKKKPEEPTAGAAA